MSLSHDGRGSPQREPDGEQEPHLRRQLEEALVRCARLADQQINERYLEGQKPDHRKCMELAPNGQEWSAWLGLLKHAATRQCLDAELPGFLPGRFRLEVRFRYNSHRAEWEPLTDKEFDQFFNQFGWQILNNIVAPDVVILDATGTRVVAVYDFKFPCPETNEARWTMYKAGHRWQGSTQYQAWSSIFKVTPKRVSPLKGIYND